LDSQLWPIRLACEPVEQRDIARFSCRLMYQLGRFSRGRAAQVSRASRAGNSASPSATKGQRQRQKKQKRPSISAADDRAAEAAKGHGALASCSCGW